MWTGVSLLCVLCWVCVLQQDSGLLPAPPAPPLLAPPSISSLTWREVGLF